MSCFRYIVLLPPSHANWSQKQVTGWEIMQIVVNTIWMKKTKQNKKNRKAWGKLRWNKIINKPFTMPDREHQRN